jgi:hypothetical protein
MKIQTASLDDFASDGHAPSRISCGGQLHGMAARSCEVDSEGRQCPAGPIIPVHHAKLDRNITGQKGRSMIG